MEADDRRFPVNNYSGLNSLRARMKNRHWDGSSPLTTKMCTDSIQGEKTDSISKAGTDSLPGKWNAAINRPDTISAAGYFALMQHGDECIGSPVYFFFDLNSARLTDNNTLSTARADYITDELIKRGIPAENITKVYEGGISDYVPDEANRHTKVELYFR